MFATQKPYTHFSTVIKLKNCPLWSFQLYGVCKLRFYYSIYKQQLKLLTSLLEKVILFLRMYTMKINILI